MIEVTIQEHLCTYGKIFSVDENNTLFPFWKNIIKLGNDDYLVLVLMLFGETGDLDKIIAYHEHEGLLFSQVFDLERLEVELFNLAIKMQRDGMLC